MYMHINLLTIASAIAIYMYVQTCYYSIFSIQALIHRSERSFVESDI